MDNYLHKKFKKQLNHEPRAQQQNDKENKVVEAPQEKNPDNNIIVPNQSTNNQSDLPKSSISSDSGNSKHISHTEDDSFSEPPPPVDDPSPVEKTNGKYVCNYCNLVCSKPSVLQKHIRAHTNERPYPCTSCGFSFKTRSNLYKHCRSRTHANRVMGVKAQEDNATQTQPEEDIIDTKKPYKPRFHQVQEDERDLSHHINEIISKNHSIVNSSDPGLLKRRYSELDNNANEEPLNLTKTRTRCMSEATEPNMQKSLIKELLLKNLYSDMQCVYCKMIFQTVTELELHKLRSCKGKPEAKYARSSSVNVASILTKNKNAFDNMPQYSFPLNSPGPFLGTTRLVDGEKSKSFSFDVISDHNTLFKEEKKAIKLFGGEVKVHGGKSYRIDNQEEQPPSYDHKLENRLVKSSLQSGGTVLTNQTSKEEPKVYRDVIRVYENTSVSPNIDMVNLAKPHFNFEEPLKPPRQDYTNITDFSQNAVKLLTPNLRHPSIHLMRSVIQKPEPMNLLVNGKVVRHVPGIPGPVVAEESMDVMYSPVIQPVDPQPQVVSKPDVEPNNKKFARPNSLALKPTTASLKQHHGLTPTIFNQILISPDTPRVVKKYSQHLFNGNYFSYLGLKSSTKPVYCTLNKTQPFYVPHFKKLSMYSEWRQQDTKTDKLYVSAYDSRQTNHKYSMAGRRVADLIIHSSYKFVVSELPQRSYDEPTIVECEDSPYIRGRGRGKYVCEQCGIRCKKPSMLKKHIRTHSNDRPYTCNHCNFSFKTKGNLTKHMKSKSHTKNYATSTSPGSSTRLSMSQSSESDTDDSGMDSSDESMTRQQEHEAAYGLLSLSQKTTIPSEILSPTGIRSPSSTNDQITSEEIAQVSKANYAKNKTMNVSYKPNKPVDIDIQPPRADEQVTCYLGKTSAQRPLTYPYTSVLEPTEERQSPEPKSIKHFNVIQKYAREEEIREVFPSPVPALKVNDVPVQEVERKRKHSVIENYKPKLVRNDEVIDLSVAADLRTYEIDSSSSNSDRPPDFDNSAMETLADVATKQVKLDKNTLAKNVASEYLKLATNESLEGGRSNGFIPSKEAISDKLSEGNKSCTICQKSFNKPFQLRLHMNIHYLERPFRCDSCSVSFRTKGHLQKHERSASHYSKLSSSPAQSSSEPRPFKCTDCSIAFRIHGHLAKHLRSKMHIMKLECLAKIPFGLYAELERSNSLLTEINTSDGDQCLESLKTLAKKVFINEPNKLQTVMNDIEADPDS